jgi:hypothetical protein
MCLFIFVKYKFMLFHLICTASHLSDSLRIFRAFNYMITVSSIGGVHGTKEPLCATVPWRSKTNEQRQVTSCWIIVTETDTLLAAAQAVVTPGHRTKLPIIDVAAIDDTPSITSAASTKRQHSGRRGVVSFTRESKCWLDTTTRSCCLLVALRDLQTRVLQVSFAFKLVLWKKWELTMHFSQW